MKKQTKIKLVGEVKQFQKIAGILKEGYMGTPYASSEEMAVDMIKKGITREDADYESQSGDTATMGNINEEDEQLTAKEVKDILLTADLTPEEMKKCRISDTNYGYVEFRHGYWEGHIPQNIANALEAHLDVKQNDVDTDEGRLYYYELRPKQNISRINEAGNVKGIKIEIPGNSYASDFGKAAAREVIESFGPREYRNFLEAFLAEFKKITGGN